MAKIKFRVTRHKFQENLRQGGIMKINSYRRGSRLVSKSFEFTIDVVICGKRNPNNVIFEDFARKRIEQLYQCLVDIGYTAEDKSKWNQKTFYCLCDSPKDCTRCQRKLESIKINIRVGVLGRGEKQVNIYKSWIDETFDILFNNFSEISQMDEFVTPTKNGYSKMNTLDTTQKTVNKTIVDIKSSGFRDILIQRKKLNEKHILFDKKKGIDRKKMMAINNLGLG
ncbi:predicted protein [Candida tropicalis MYA-3404]|uniref:Uncharacterized protein n=1 Tax=Candida tropicalis (strain ATCC MYA-3404 / T1) TaxID=294747 RepID=C5M477_CANTT|nr:predicted protein [Candida tropicalis MYA-3404]EER36127.1 predicted protein [Candida tropicalis MYA-3404]KAG4410246.1 hypothetical protein JTP64_000884 [Candida tropicalis]MCP8716633.1 hypothetical protein [Asgard group archaeon]